MIVSIIIPVYNEKNNIIKTIFLINEYFKNKNTFEIIVVDDGSDDDVKLTLKDLDMKNLVIIRNKRNFGKGYSIKQGVIQSKGDLILISDADLSTPIKEFERLNQELLNGNDIVIGSRNISGSKIIVKQNLIRIFIGKFFNILVRFLTKLNFRDTQCGFKLFNAEKLRNIIQMCFVNRFSTDVEILYIAKKLDYKISDIGVEWKNDSKSSVNLFSDSFNMFLDLVRIQIRHKNIISKDNKFI